MKTFFTLVSILLVSLNSLAQGQNLNEATTGRLFVGAIASTVGYNLKYTDEPKGGDLRPVFTPYLKYKLNKRISAQVGVSYDYEKFDVEQIYVESPDRLIYLRDYNLTKGVAIPITLNYTFLYPLRKLELYGTAMLTPIFSTSSAEKSEQTDGITTITYSAETAGINTYIGFGYPRSNRFDIYGNYYRLNKSPQTNPTTL